MVPQDSLDNQAVISKLFGIEQHTSLLNEESSESIEVRPTRPSTKPPGIFLLTFMMSQSSQH